MQEIQNLAEAQSLALAIVDAIVDPFVFWTSTPG
jgi:hypothetical protein